MSTAELAPGTVVRVKALYPPGHCRTPYYTRGKTGIVRGTIDHQPDPEALAYGRDGLPRLPVYRVEFPITELFPERPPSRDAVIVDLFGPWLEPLAPESRA